VRAREGFQPHRLEPPRRTRLLSTPATAPVLRRWAWLVVLAVGLGLFELVREVLTDTNNPNLVPSLILLGAAAVPTSFVAFIYGRELNFDVGTGTVVVVAFLGGVIGVVTSALIEYHTLRELGTLPTLAVGLIEEAAKLVVPIGILFLTDHRRPANGLLVGVACGAGFAAMETMGYSAVALVRSHESIASVDALLLERGLFSPATHMAWTGLTAAALWHAGNRGWTVSAVLGLLAVFALAVALHATWDSADSVAAYIPIAAVSLISLTVAAHRLASAPNHHAPGTASLCLYGSARQLQ
jgi:protease PrsW